VIKKMDTYYSKDKKECCTNNIAEIIEKIARSQRDVCSTCVEPVSCDMCFYNTLFNTIPIRLSLCCSGAPVEGLIGAGRPSTSYFRVECISNKRFVKLRLLSATVVEGVVVLAGTNYTIVVDLECVGSIQCFEPINITVTAPTV
jgi:hypothetical protein